MRLTSFALENYGNFRQLELHLDPDPGRINLIVAPNGAGKTVLRTAFRDWLFGIPSQTPMGFRFGYPGMRLFAEGIDHGGSPFAIGRRKGTGNTLIDAHGNSVEPPVFNRLVGEADESLFKRLFALDTELLRAGVKAIIETGGELGEALFTAGSGVAGMRRLREGLETLRDERAPARRVSSRPLYQALDSLAKARSDLRSATVRPQAWQELSGKLAFTRDQLGQLARDQSDRQRTIAVLERIRRVRPWLERRETARGEFQEAAGAPKLPSDTADRWRTSAGALVLTEQEVRTATEEIQRIAEAVAAEKPDDALLQNGERIDAIDRRREQITADLRDLPRREGERNDAVAQLGSRLTALGIDTFERIASVIPNSPEIAEARDLIKRHSVLTERIRNAKADLARTDRELADATVELEQVPQPVEVSRLVALVERATAEGDPTRRFAEFWARVGREEARLDAALAQQPLWDKGLDALVAIVPPTRQVIDRTASALDAARRALAEADGELQRLERERGDAGERLAHEREGKPVPDEAAVVASREHRDLGWSLIRRSRFEGEPLLPEIAAYADSRGLAGAFEQALRDADDLADRRNAESRRLARIEQCERQIRDLNQQIANAKRRLDETQQRHDGAAASWLKLLANFGLSMHLEADDLRDILAARQKILEIRAARDEAQAALSAETQRQDIDLRELADLLPPEKCRPLSEALAAARQIIDCSNEARRQRDLIETRLAEMRRTRQRAENEQKAALSELAEWQAGWQACLSGLKRPSTETPAAAERAIELISEAHQLHDRLRDLDHRISGMKRNIAEFETEIAALAGTVACDLQGRPAQSVAEELRRLLREQRDIRTRRDQLLDQRTTATERLDQARRRQAHADARRLALHAEIGGASDLEVEARIDLAARRSAVERQLAEIDGELSRIGDGLPIEALEKEAAAGPDSNTIERKLADLQAEVERMSHERERAAVEEERLGAELQRIESGIDAIDAEERRQAGIAAALRISEEALLYHAAACLIRHGMERIRDLGEEGLIRRIGEVFKRITGGVYSGVAADEDAKGTPYLIAIEADGTTKRVNEDLSEGSRDQLFLALRLVMVEEYAKKAPALPFVADDLLQTFDDYGRTANALAALTDLSWHAQVIVLSHHRHLGEIAKELPVGTVNVCTLAA